MKSFLVKKVRTPLIIIWKYQIGDLVDIRSDCFNPNPNVNPWKIENYAISNQDSNGDFFPCYILEDPDDEFDDEYERTYFEWALKPHKK